ncbi:MAG: type II toxin-antitoxin system VapC family toxin [Propionibacteriaceae bacterium]|nr:type II toxin-antitoxin system VapC family toxin [Propionibacteriaceae bacterium]
MIVDSSALMAIVNDERDAERVLACAVSGPCRMSAATWVEVGIVADARSARHGERIDAIVEQLRIEIVPVSVRQAEVARLAYRRFGRGSGSAARLNFGDCFSYALSVTSGEPLLFVGADFAHTDVASALRH